MKPIYFFDNHKSAKDIIQKILQKNRSKTKRIEGLRIIFFQKRGHRKRVKNADKGEYSETPEREKNSGSIVYVDGQKEEQFLKGRVNARLRQLLGYISIG